MARALTSEKYKILTYLSHVPMQGATVIGVSYTAGERQADGFVLDAESPDRTPVEGRVHVRG